MEVLMAKLHWNGPMVGVPVFLFHLDDWRVHQGYYWKKTLLSCISRLKHELLMEMWGWTCHDWLSNCKCVCPNKSLHHIVTITFLQQTIWPWECFVVQKKDVGFIHPLIWFSQWYSTHMFGVLEEELAFTCTAWNECTTPDWCCLKIAHPPNVMVDHFVPCKWLFGAYHLFRYQTHHITY